MTKVAHITIERRFVATQFADILRSVVFSASDDVNRPVLQCVNLSMHDGCLTFLATDSRVMKLARWRHEIKGIHRMIGDGKVFLASDLLKLAKFIEKRFEDGGTIVFRENEDGFDILAFGSGSSKTKVKITSPEAMPPFPNYRNIIPKYSHMNPSKVVVLNPLYFEGIGKFMRIVTSDLSTSSMGLRLDKGSAPIRFETRGMNWDGLVLVMPIVGIKDEFPYSDDGDVFTAVEKPKPKQKKHKVKIRRKRKK